MPQWLILLALAIVAWLMLSIVGGLAVGRLLDVCVRALASVFRPRLR